MWNLPAPPGFQGLHPDKPVSVRVRLLPHWRQDGATYFATFRLGDSLPEAKVRELRKFREAWKSRHPPPRSNQLMEEFSREVFTRVERWIDQGMGSCVLKEPSAAAIMTGAMHHFDGERYQLGAYVVMPNHVHVVVRPTEPQVHSLDTIIGIWKQFASGKINSQAGDTGSLWQDEGYDRIIRDEEHLYRVLQYIVRNPKKAGLPLTMCPRWVRPDWIALGWKFEEL
jgi:putative transposase